MNTKEMNTILNSINETINNSHESYYERFKDDVDAQRDINVANLYSGTATEDIEDDLPTWDFDGEEMGYSSFTTSANVIREEFQYSSGDSFQIGNNIKGGI